MPFVAGPDMRGYVYTDGEGDNWVLRARREVAEYTDATGNVTDFTIWTGAESTNGPMPTNFKPRSVQVVNPAFGSRNVVCFTTDARLWTGAATSVQMRAPDGTVATYNRSGQNPERRRKPIKPEL